ncbi:DUF4917 family protein [Terasakiella pusilla]|uniref:DUF4917 family protein n=1 Tax=Terasakiella pusilla TaxID=64973 RepID=UPI003AA7E38D
MLTFEDAVNLTQGEDRHILLGNGFTMAQSGGLFGYNNLLERSGLERGSEVRNLFDNLDTYDFEEVVQALEHAAQVLDVYGDGAFAEKLYSDADEVREGLIEAVKNVHPENQFGISEEQVTACSNFLSNFRTVFTLNYDLLTYWLNFRARSLGLNRIFDYTDGFGQLEYNREFREFSERSYCRVYNLHGALHLFLGKEKRTIKRIKTGDSIIQDIEETIVEDEKMPIFVSEGTSSKKMEKINSIPYLRHGYEQLKSREGVMFVFGHSADDKDEHIYKAIASSKIASIYFCVHDPDANLHEIEGRMNRIVSLAWREFRKTLIINYVDAASCNVWGEE